MTLDVRAKGGRYTTKLGVVLGGLDKKYIKETTVRIVLKGGQGTEQELATGTDMAEVREVNGQAQYCKVTIDTKGDSPVVILDGLSDLGDNTNFFQVTPGYVEEGRPMLRAEVKLTGVNRSDAGVTKAESDAQLAAYRELITDTKKQNFFIVTHDNKEIHMKGYKPTYSYTNYDTDSKGLMMDNVPYCNKNGFVWGIKVPVGIAHASEKVLFSTAYPKFKEWVESDGAKNKDWYLHPAAGKVIRSWSVYSERVNRFVPTICSGEVKTKSLLHRSCLLEKMKGHYIFSCSFLLDRDFLDNLHYFLEVRERELNIQTLDSFL